MNITDETLMVAPPHDYTATIIIIIFLIVFGVMILVAGRISYTVKMERDDTQSVI